MCRTQSDSIQELALKCRAKQRLECDGINHPSVAQLASKQNEKDDRDRECGEATFAWNVGAMAAPAQGESPRPPPPVTHRSDISPRSHWGSTHLITALRSETTADR
ncbi:unnamed protein product, partial [Iphiclides podalirius]